MNSINSFYLRFITSTILTLTILGVTINHCVAVNNNTALTAIKNSNADQNYNAAVSKYQVSLQPHTQVASTLITAVIIIIIAIIIPHYTHYNRAKAETQLSEVM